MWLLISQMVKVESILIDNLFYSRMCYFCYSREIGYENENY